MRFDGVRENVEENGLRDSGQVEEDRRRDSEQVNKDRLRDSEQVKKLDGGIMSRKRGWVEG